MPRAAYSAKAVSDLRDIWLYSANTCGSEQADQYTDDIQDACRDLASGRKVGRVAPERSGYFRFLIARHGVFFVKRGEGILVMRILHQRMDVARYLDDPEG